MRLFLPTRGGLESFIGLQSRRMERCVWVGAFAVAMASMSCGEPPAPRAPVPAKTGDVGDPIKAADDVESGERQVEAAAGDCASACAGLTKMQAGRDTLCAQKAPACSDATARAKKAEAAVASFCDPCGGAP